MPVRTAAPVPRETRWRMGNPRSSRGSGPTRVPVGCQVEWVKGPPPPKKGWSERSHTFVELERPSPSPLRRSE
jgi:hypothetical protein